MLTDLLQENLINGLHNKTLKRASYWAERVRIMGEPYPGPYSFKHHPWIREMLDTDHEDCIGQKAAQMGYTEAMLNRALYTIDIKRRDVLYVLPNSNPDASDFSHARFDPALELSEHLSSIFSNRNNVGLKMAGEVSLYVRGSNSRKQLKSIPVSVIIFDEADEMEQEAMILGDERISGHEEYQVWKISTPHIPNHGINMYFENSTQEFFHFKCPHCSRSIQLIFPDCLVITGDDPNDPEILNTHMICPMCKHKLKHETKHEYLADGVWIPDYPGRLSRGFHINQLYSPSVKPSKLGIMYLRSHSNPAYEQEFYNSKLGLPHIVSGARITDNHVEDCMGEFKNQSTRADGAITMGVDVGKFLHWIVTSWKVDRKEGDINDSCVAKVIAFGKIESSEEAGFHELDELLSRYQPQKVVIDALPETRSSQSFCTRLAGRAYMCYYSAGNKARSLTVNDQEHTTTVNRTAWLDQVFSRIRNKRVRLPIDIDREFKQHMTALVRVYKQNKDGQDISSYAGNAADHYAHASLYNEIALRLIRSSGSGTVESPL